MPKFGGQRIAPEQTHHDSCFDPACIQNKTVYRHLTLFPSVRRRMLIRSRHDDHVTTKLSIGDVIARTAGTGTYGTGKMQGAGIRRVGWL